MSFNLSALSDYTNEYGNDLVAKMVAQGQTLKYITIQPGIKSADNIPTFSSSIALQAGACGWNVTGSTTLGKMNLAVDAIDMMEALCIKDAEKKGLQWMIKDGSSGDDTSFAQKFVGEKMEQISLANENLAWQGNKTSGAGNLARTNGFLYYLTNTSASASTVNTSGYSGVSAGNVIGLVDYMVANIPTAIKTRTDLVLFMGTDSYATYLIALKNANLFHVFDTNGAGPFQTTHPVFTNIKIVGTVGLDGTNKMVLTSSANLYAGTDLLSEDDRVDLWYSKDNREIRIAANYKLGFAVMFPDFVVFHKQA